GTVSFSLTGADAALFDVNATTGDITFKASPNFEAPADNGGDNTYDIIVHANDGVNDTTKSVAITVTDANEAPTITSNGGGATASVSVAENTTAVTTVTATDPDAGDALTYSISGGADAAKFAIDGKTGVLTFVAAPNFESPTDAGADNVYDVVVKATDKGALVDTQAIAVTVTDVNDATTTTTKGGGATAAVAVAENATAVTTVTASDPDAGDALTYSISGGVDAAKFTIDGNTGVLTFVAAPNFESPTDAGADNVYDVVVKATDKGALVDTQAIAVTVTDV